MLIPRSSGAVNLTSGTPTTLTGVLFGKSGVLTTADAIPVNGTSGGTGTAINLTGGTGGGGSVGGIGGNILLIAGQGGADGGSFLGGNGGNVTLRYGARGVGTSLNGSDGSIIFQDRLTNTRFQLRDSDIRFLLADTTVTASFGLTAGSTALQLRCVGAADTDITQLWLNKTGAARSGVDGNGKWFYSSGTVLNWSNAVGAVGTNDLSLARAEASRLIIGDGVGGVGNLTLGSIITSADATVGLIVKKTATQSSNLTEWQDDSGVAGARVTNNRNFSRPNGVNSEQFGQGSNATGAGSVAIGQGCTVAGANSVGIGNGVNAGSGGSSFVLGNFDNSVSNHANIVNIGVNAVNTGASSLAIGTSAIAGDTSVSIGIGASSNSPSSSVAIGGNAAADFIGSIAIGRVAIAEAAGDIVLGGFGSVTRDFKIVGQTDSNYRSYATKSFSWLVNTDASRTARVVHNITGNAANQEYIRADGDVGGVKLSFYGVSATARQLLATGAGHTVDDVITALQTLGLVRQS